MWMLLLYLAFAITIQSQCKPQGVITGCVTSFDQRFRKCFRDIGGFELDIVTSLVTNGTSGRLPSNLSKQKQNMTQKLCGNKQRICNCIRHLLTIPEATCQQADIGMMEHTVDTMISGLGNICDKKQGVRGCSLGWIPMVGAKGNTCVWLSTQKDSWIDAMNWCRALDGHLVEYTSGNFNRNLASLIKMKNPGKYWIGLTSVENKNIYRWMTSKETAFSVPMLFPPMFFKAGQPFGDTAKQCVNIDHNGEWILDSCKTECFYICQKNNVAAQVIG